MTATISIKVRGSTVYVRTPSVITDQNFAAVMTMKREDAHIFTSYMEVADYLEGMMVDIDGLTGSVQVTYKR